MANGDYISRKWKLALGAVIFAALQWGATAVACTALLWWQRGVDGATWASVLSAATTAWWLATGSLVGLYYGANVAQKRLVPPNETETP